MLLIKEMELSSKADAVGRGCDAARINSMAVRHTDPMALTALHCCICGRLPSLSSIVL
jgi:hypothetical protein